MRNSFDFFYTQSYLKNESVRSTIFNYTKKDDKNKKNADANKVIYSS